MKRTLDSRVLSKTSSKGKKEKIWTTEQDAFLREEIEKSKAINWRSICKKFNKTFKPVKVTSKECGSRWSYLSAELSINEEIIILLTFYRGNQEIAATVLKSRVNVSEYLESLIIKVKNKVESFNKIKDGLTWLMKLKLLICLGLSLSSEQCDKRLGELAAMQKDWMEVVQTITGKKEKLTTEMFREHVDTIVANIESKVNLLAESNNNELNDVMHERRDNPSEIVERLSPSNLLQRIGIGIYSQFNYDNRGPNN